MTRLRGNQARILLADGHDAAGGHEFNADNGFQDAEFMSPEDSVTRPDASGAVGTTKLGFVEASAAFTVWNTVDTAPLLAGRDGNKATVRVRVRGSGQTLPQAQFNATYVCAFNASRRGVFWRVTLPGRDAPVYFPQT